MHDMPVYSQKDDSRSLSDEIAKEVADDLEAFWRNERGTDALCCLEVGQKARVCAVGGVNRCRLMEMGFTNGTQVEVVRRAAFGGPIEVRLRSYRLSLRRDEAESIRVDCDREPLS